MGALRSGDSVRLTLQSDPRHLCLVRAMVRSFGSLAGFDDALTHRITLAVDEGCTNIIRHAYGGRADGEIAVTCSLEALQDGALRLVVRLLDHGAPAPGDEPLARDRTDPLVPGGLGIHLMRDIMDTVRFLRDPDGGNVLELGLLCPAAAVGESHGK
jgi:anti-sigma regulatory factor (Ser/Thr protein kinase)